MAVPGTIGQLRLDRLIDPKPSPERERVLAMIAAQVLDPGSKLAAPGGWISGRWTRMTCMRRWTGCWRARGGSSGAWPNGISGTGPWSCMT